LGLTILLIHIPPIQNALSSKLTTYLSEGTGYRTEIDYINIKWFNSITMDGTRIYDENGVLMIGVEELALSFKLSSLLGKKDIVTEEAWVYGADVNIRYNNEDEGLNIDEWARRFTSLAASGDSTTESGAFLLNEIDLIDSKFSISDSRRDSINNGFNYNHFQLVNINADLLNLRAKADSFQIDVTFLTAEDKASGLKVDNIQTYFRYSTKGMHFLNLNLKTGKSRINNSISFLHEHPSQMSSFIDSVEIIADLEDTYLHTDDLSFFVPDFKEENVGIGISGKYRGKVNSFVGEQFELRIGEGTRLRGEMDIEGLPEIENSFFDLTFDKTQLHPEDLKRIFSERNYAIIENFGDITLTGEFDGFLNNFVADGTLTSDIGDIITNLQINTSEEIPSYDGYLELVDFDLGSYIEDSRYQKIDLAGNINGSGFRLDDAQFNLVAEVERFGINGYEINNIETDGAIAESFFSGQLSVNDSNLRLFANGSVDLRDQARIFNINGRIDNIALDSLNLIGEPLNLSSQFNIDVEGIKLDSLIGDIQLLNTHVAFRNREMDFDTLLFSSSKTDQIRSLSLESEQLDFAIEGNFLFTTLLREFNDYKYQNVQFFQGNIEESVRYANNEGKSTQTFDLSYEADLKEINGLMNLLDTTISVANNGRIRGSFSSAQDESFAVEVYLPEVIYRDVIFKENEIAFQGSRISSPLDLNVLGYVYSQEQQFNENTSTNDLTMDAVWTGEHIDIRNSIAEPVSGNYAELGGDVDFFEDKIELHFEDSNIIAYEEQWEITNSNRITFTSEKISIDSLNIFNNQQNLRLDGAIAIVKDSLETMSVYFSNVEMKNINPLTSQDYQGALNGELTAQNLLFDPLFFGQVSLDELTINDFLVGNITGDLNWNDPLKKLEVGFSVKRDQKEIIKLNGGVFPRQNEQLELTLMLNETNLAIAEPYISEYLTKIDGSISGEFGISGKINSPAFRGQGNIDTGQMNINYLNTLYQFDGNISVGRNLITLDDFVFRDVNNNTALFGGDITHDDYSDFKLDLLGELYEFQVMNLPNDLKADFFGQAYASGDVQLIGEAANLTILADVRTEGASEIFIPIGKQSDEVLASDYIQFIDRTDTLDNTQSLNIQKSDVEQLKIEGLTLDLNIEVTPQASAQLIIDPRTGDIIRGRGNGQLRLVIDSDGDFQMTGGIDIVEGAYNFSLYSIINKEFQIEQPSSITWYGDPYAGVMSINASYDENTPITPILEAAGFVNTEEGGSNLGRRVPVKVLLGLEGPLLSPEINFDIDFGEISAQDYETTTSINAFKNRIQTDEQELNRQVLSLILLGKFSDQGNVNIVGGAATQSVSQLLSNQLSQLVAQLDENLEVDFDLRDLSNEAFNTMRLRLSYTFLEGRLRVTREGGLADVQDVSSAVGDWTAEYLLTPDGRYKVKIYYRSNYDYTAGAISQSGTFTTQGASVTQTSSFNSFKELFRKIEKDRENPEKEDEEPNKTTRSSN
jgi:hypothetical protein